MTAVTNNHTPYAFRKLEKACSFFSCDCISEESAIKIGKVALGVLAFVVVTPLIGLAVKGVSDLLVSYGCDISPKQDAMQIWDQLGELPAFFSIPLKTVLGVYIVALGPIFEEFIFRELFRDLSATIVHGIGHGPDTFWGKVEMVLLNGLAFTIHTSIFQSRDGQTLLCLYLLFSGVAFFPSCERQQAISSPLALRISPTTALS